MNASFLASLHFTVVDANDPKTPLCPNFLSEYEAQALANELVDLTGQDYIVVDANELEEAE